MASRSKIYCSPTRKHSPIYRVERKPARRQTVRQDRHKASNLLRQGRYDEVPRKTKGTQGWLSW